MTQNADYQALTGRARPRVLTGLAINGELYLHSSLKGGAFIYLPDNINNPARKAVIACQTVWNIAKGRPADSDENTDRHQNLASCVSHLLGMLGVDPRARKQMLGRFKAHGQQGEAMCAYSYFQDHPEATDISGGVWVAVDNGSPMRTDITFEGIAVKDPCGKDVMPEELEAGSAARFGCMQLTKELKVDAIRDNVGFIDFLIPEDQVKTFSNPHLQCAAPAPARARL
jgi:hypothetical protein